MADFTGVPDGSGAGIPAGKFVNIAAAAVSIALVGGVGVWGYKLLMRDVTGVPVVRALGGEMRISPENPGGEIASHVGLSVNSVLAEGGAAAPEDSLVLAPSTVNLQADDMFVAAPEDAPTDDTPERLAEAAEVTPAPVEPVIAAVPTTLELDDAVASELATDPTPVDPTAPLTAEDVLALADQIAAGAQPLEALAEGETVPLEVSVNGVVVNPDIIPDAVPGVRKSIRPASRPAGRAAPTDSVTAAVAAAAATATTTSTAATPVTGEVTTAAIPVGTKLVQLGAFDTPDIAATEWVRHTARFPDFFDGKSQVIQQAQSGGRTFFRLRAMGFDELSDARRFCAALSAEGADCIPVVVR